MGRGPLRCYAVYASLICTNFKRPDAPLLIVTWTLLHTESGGNQAISSLLALPSIGGDLIRASHVPSLSFSSTLSCVGFYLDLDGLHRCTLSIAALGDIPGRFLRAFGFRRGVAAIFGNGGVVIASHTYGVQITIRNIVVFRGERNYPRYGMGVSRDLELIEWQR